MSRSFESYLHTHTHTHGICKRLAAAGVDVRSLFTTHTHKYKHASIRALRLISLFIYSAMQTLSVVAVDYILACIYTLVDS